MEDLDFSPREIIAAMVERGFPMQLYRDKTDPASGRTIQVLATDESGAPIQSREVDEEIPEFTERIICPACGGAIPTVWMDVRFIARYTCPHRGKDVLIEGDDLRVD